jgi:hypothetical protein
MDAVTQGRIHSGDVVVIRNEGPYGGPGMREMLAVTGAINTAKLGLATWRRSTAISWRRTSSSMSLASRPRRHRTSAPSSASKAEVEKRATVADPPNPPATARQKYRRPSRVDLDLQLLTAKSA